MDGRKNNGGHSTKGYAGRKPKEDEDRIRTLSITALESIYGSEEKAFEFIAESSKESFPHLKLLLEYAYGKPRITQEIIEQREQPLHYSKEERGKRIKKYNSLPITSCIYYSKVCFSVVKGYGGTIYTKSRKSKPEG